MAKLHLLSISETSCRWLERAFDKEEILGALHDMDGDTALGPYGFMMAFFKHC